jgi:hypothetical protein
MSIKELIDLLQARLTYTQGQRAVAAQRGDVAMVQQLDADITSTQATLTTLQLLFAT